MEGDPRLFAGVVRAILDANFPTTLHEDILDANGIALETAELAEVPVPAGEVKRRRDPAFRERILLAYKYQCAVCGYDGQLQRETVGIDAAHIRWWAAEGPDDVGNGIAACSIHHKLLDRGAIGLTAEHKLAVSAHFIARGQMADILVISLVGRPLLRPQPGHPRAAAEHIAWHTSEVFRGPARQVST